MTLNHWTFADEVTQQNLPHCATRTYGADAAPSPSPLVRRRSVMAKLKLETLVQSVLARNVVVAGSERIGTRLADRATPTLLPFAWLPAHDADAGPNPLVNRGEPAMRQNRGLRAG